MGCPGCMRTISYTCISIYARFSGQFFSKFSQKKIVTKKKDRCAVFGCNNDRLFPEKYTLKFFFARKACVNTERVPPVHPIILLKSIKFNMAAVSVKKVYWFGLLAYHRVNFKHVTKQRQLYGRSHLNVKVEPHSRQFFSSHKSTSVKKMYLLFKNMH